MTQQTEDTRSRAALGFRPAPPVKPNKGGRPRKAGIDREPNGQASRRLVIDLRPTPEQIARGAGSMSPNDIRVLENQSPIPGCDVYHVPANWLPLGLNQMGDAL